MKQPIHLENRAIIGEKLVSPSAERNCAPIGDQLQKILPTNASVLEIASGTGQHGHHMCGLRLDVKWQMTDIDEKSLASQAAYAADFPDRMAPPRALDVTVGNWWHEFTGVDVIYCANMIHIAPWTAAEGVARGAGQLISNSGCVCLYGPFLPDTGVAESNLKFDKTLQERNPDWGVRTLKSVKHIFAEAGLNLAATVEMPRDNFLLVFTRNP